MNKKFLSIMIIHLILFSSLTVFPISSEATVNILSEGTTLYVGGSEPGNYTMIQNALDDASDGDTIFVYSGIYNENIIVNKSITLKGEKKENTIINSEFKTAVLIKVDNFTITGFKIILKSQSEVSIDVKSDNSIIYNNIIKGVIFLLSSDNNTIMKNEIINGGISLFDSSFNNIVNNIVRNHRFTGININQYSFNNNVSYNTVKFCTLGIDLYHMNNKICNNNLFFNVLHGRIAYKNGNFTSWNHNYWGRSRIIPKALFGYGIFYQRYPCCFDLDLRPAKIPQKHLC